MTTRQGIALVALLCAAACGDDASTSNGGAGGEGNAPSNGGGGAAADGGAGGVGGTGGTGGSSEGGAACVSGLEQSTSECTACQDEHCCLSASAAADEPGTWTNSAAKICREANCWQECGVEEPECGGIVPTPASCADDLYASCCAEVTACAESDSCTALIYICIDDRGCAPGSACFNMCAEEFPGGEALFDALDECFADVTCT